MDLTYVTIVVLASMVFVLSAMVGYLYWQQTRMMQHLQSVSMAVATLVNPPPETIEAEEPQPAETETVDIPEVEEEEEEDDRVSVEQVSEPPAPKPATEEIDIDDIREKTAAQLRDILTKKGIPFGKRDSKSVLIELLQATA
jgi:outer membrane biosynthesis protein TonB